MRVGSREPGRLQPCSFKELGAKVKDGLRIRTVASSDASFTIWRQSLGIDDDGARGAAGTGYCILMDRMRSQCSQESDWRLIKGRRRARCCERRLWRARPRSFLVVVDSSKDCEALLGKFPLPVEVVKMALPLV